MPTGARVVLLSCILIVAWAAPAPAHDQSAIEVALSHPDRLAEDRELDDKRKPGEVLAFFGVGPGSTVLDVFSGGGYYTGILSPLIGPEGTVIAHNNNTYIGFVTDELDKRYAQGRPGNVRFLVAEANDLEIKPGSVDTALMILSYHDMYFRPEKLDWPEIDPARFLGNIFAALRPGGVLGIVDHVASPGSPPESGNTLHRIDPALVRRQVEDAGFVFDGESEALRNPGDDHLLEVFDERIRRRTDRFILRFRKPE